MVLFEDTNDSETCAGPIPIARAFVHGCFLMFPLARLDRVCISLSPPPYTFLTTAS
jgi:hypothetical protein